MAQPGSVQRQKRLLDQFRRKLEGLSADEIQQMLDRRRIRSPERIALAQAMLQQRGRGEASAETAGAGPLAQMAARAGDGTGTEAEQPSERKQETSGGQAAAGAAVPVARQIGRVLGIGLGIAGIAALAIFAIRR